MQIITRQSEIIYYAGGIIKNNPSCIRPLVSNGSKMFTQLKYMSG